MNPRNETKAGVCSAAIHAAIIALLLLAQATKPTPIFHTHVTPLFAPVELKPFKLAKSAGGSGGRGGANPTPRQFAPPKADFQQTNLLLAPTITADLPNLTLAELTIPAVTQTGGGGIGNENYKGPGKGNGPHGPGTGDGDDGPGDGGHGLRTGNGVSAPTLLFSPEPEYSEEARKAKFQGTVRLALIVDEHGNPAHVRIITPLGLGLDEKAIEAVHKWKFKPGTKDGKPVAVQASVEVNFRLL